MKSILAAILGLVIGAAIASAVIGLQPEQPFGAAQGGIASVVATSTQATVSGTAQTVFATSTNCASRVINTGAASIMITFTDRFGETPSATRGYFQGTSTQVVYDCGLYGNGAVKVYSGTAQTITVMETR